MKIMKDHQMNMMPGMEVEHGLLNDYEIVYKQDSFHLPSTFIGFQGVFLPTSLSTPWWGDLPSMSYRQGPPPPQFGFADSSVDPSGRSQTEKPRCRRCRRGRKVVPVGQGRMDQAWEWHKDVTEDETPP